MAQSGIDQAVRTPDLLVSCLCAAKARPTSYGSDAKRQTEVPTRSARATDLHC